MAGNSPSEAVEAYRAPLQRALSCVTQNVLMVQGTQANAYQPATDPHVIILNQGNPTRLRGDAPLALTFLQQYRIVESDDPDRGPWKVSTAAYVYALETIEGTSERRAEIVAYHWQPGLPAGAPFPHLHIGSGAVGSSAQIGPSFLHKVHFPTNRIAIEDVIHLAIDAFGAEPLRDDWAEVLNDTRAAYHTWKTW